MPLDDVTHASWQMVKPTHAWGPGPQIQREQKSSRYDLGTVQQAVALVTQTQRASTLTEVAFHGARQAGLTGFDVEPSPGIDHLDGTVDRRKTA
jgi:hypothetical protein